MKTREKILQTALELFNERGTSAVSTNHIAEEMGISPGNLYYHFRNKGEIIAELVGKYVSYFDSFYFNLVDTDSGDEAILSLPDRIKGSMEHAWTYRFYLREISSLFQQYPKLKMAYRTVRTQRVDPFYEVLKEMEEMELLVLPEDPVLKSNLNRTIWLISHFWISLLDMEKDNPTKADMAESSRMILDLFRPYLTEKAKTLLQM